MSGLHKNSNIFVLISLLLTISYFGFSFQVETIDFAALEAEVENRVNELLETGKYNLTYYTIFEYRKGNKWDNKTAKGMVVSDDVRCSRAGAYYLEHGGNIIDAAVASSLCLTVVSLASTGLSGGGIYLSYLNGEVFPKRFHGVISNTLISNDVTAGGVGEVLKIPGMIMGLHELWKQGGKIEWKALFDIPILIAYHGWDVKPTLRQMILSREQFLKSDAFLKSLLFNGDSAKSIGDMIVNKPLAGTLHLLSLNYKNMYEGAIPKIMMEQISPENHAALVSEIGAYKTKPLETMTFDMKDNYKMITSSKPTGGPRLAYILNAMRGYVERNPDVIKPDGSVEDDYYLALFDILRSEYSKRNELTYGNAMETIEDAYNQKFGEPLARKLVSRVFSPKRDTHDELDGDEDIEGSVSLNVIDNCGNAIVMQTAINTLFGGRFTYPSLGIIANTYTELKIGDDLKPIMPRPDHMGGIYAPTIVVDKTTGKVNELISGTGARKIPAAIAQVMIDHYCRGMTFGMAITKFRIFVSFPDNQLATEQYTPIPEDIVNLITAAKNVTLRTVDKGHDSSVIVIRVMRDKNGFMTRIFGSGDHRRNSGVKAV